MKMIKKIKMIKKKVPQHLKFDPLVLVALSGPWARLQHVLHAGVRQAKETQAPVIDALALLSAKSKKILDLIYFLYNIEEKITVTEYFRF